MCCFLVLIIDTVSSANNAPRYLVLLFSCFGHRQSLKCIVLPRMCLNIRYCSLLVLIIDIVPSAKNEAQY